MQDIIIATRRYACTVQQYEDRMVRKSNGTFVLIQSPDRPGGPEIVKPYSLQAVYGWLQDLPWQIRRTVVSGC